MFINIVKRSVVFIAVLSIAIFAPAAVLGANFGDKASFNIDKSYDLQKRSTVLATIQKITDKIYFYVDDAWWMKLSADDQAEISKAMDELGEEFSRKIYPTLTSVYGPEANPGIDKDSRITVLVHPMVKEAGGYFNTADEYSRLAAPLSNEREMVYLNDRYLDTAYAKTYLAHEFTHLVTFNQKDNLNGVAEENWLNEARADYAATLLGYDEPYKGSALEDRVNDFLSNPNDSLTEWLNNQADYGAVNLFMQYLADQYGTRVISDSFRSGKVGIPSIDLALQKNGIKDDFQKIFSNWIITLLVNDCSYGPRYCYKNQDLKNFRIQPKINYLPASSEATLSVTYSTTYYAGNWQKITGGAGDLSLDFFGNPDAEFSVPYLICPNDTGDCQLKTMALNADKKGSLSLPGFSSQYSSITLTPFIMGKTSGFDGRERAFSYSFKIAASQIGDKPSANDNPPANQTDAVLLSQIAKLQQEIARIKALLAARTVSVAGTKVSCGIIKNNLYYGMTGSAEVRCLQEFLKAQGTLIYPEGVVSGNFLAATRAAVIRFQEKYAAEILAPSGMKTGNGYVGAATRKAVNARLGK